MSGDKLLQKPYLIGEDLYVQMAMDLYGFERKYCEDGAMDPTGQFYPRKRSKQGLLSAMYGTSKWTLAQQMQISVDEAEKFLQTFFSTYKGVAQFIDESKQFVLQHGYVETLFRRKRRFPELADWVAQKQKLEQKRVLTQTEKERLRELRGWVNGALRAAVNARIQGTAADILKLIMIDMYKLCVQKGWKLVATIHDEIVMFVPDTITPQDIADVERVMTQTVKLDVPLACDTVIGPSLGEQYPWREWFEMNKQKEAV
jgi:DNA polymerase-1